ncbi:MAG: hypothetical protein AAGD92_00645 [Pseudomonadota bacterium]
MRTHVKFIAGLAAISTVMIAEASAQQGPKILTQFGAAERTDRSGGASVEETAGVRLIRGTRRLAGENQPAPRPTARQTVSVEVTHNYRFRSFRRLRTQGFYSGNGPRSQRFTQGFYSGR